MNDIIEPVRLTRFSHGAGCGCKISPAVLDVILKNNEAVPDDRKLLVGNHSRDDAAVYDIGNGRALISTTDFFMPVVDDAFDFGRIASANAISDVYAMGGTPTLAIAILGWPVDKIPAEVAQQVVAGSRAVCKEAGIPLAGGHSIDSPEPIFGLAVNGTIEIKNLKRNNTGKVGDLLFLTKPLGVGILTTAAKKGFLKEEDRLAAIRQMTQLNRVGEELGKLDCVHALTDVTGFGLLGHLSEMAEGSGLSAEINFKSVPLIGGIDYYLDNGCVPGGTNRNWKSYGHKIGEAGDRMKNILCDPQTSGGLLAAVDPAAADQFRKAAEKFVPANLLANPIGKITARQLKTIIIK
jgi:selenide,water dikinase